MKILAISNRVGKELLRDKRTLALIFIAPIFIILLLSLVFSTNAKTHINIGTVNVPTSIQTQLKKKTNVTLKKYTTSQTAKKALQTSKIDSIIQKDKNSYNITYANIDPSKTNATKLAFQMSFMQSNIANLKHQLTNSIQVLAKTTHQKIVIHKQKAPAIHNYYDYGNSKTNFFNKILPILIGFFVFFFVFLISGMALLRERTQGTLDRLLATSVKRSEIILGYMLIYGLFAIIQTILIIVTTIFLLHIEIKGSIFNLILINLVLALVASAFGLLVSTFANSEFQMMQFIPIIVIPQVFFSGIIPLDAMANWVKTISVIIPIKYSGDASTKIIMQGTKLSLLGPDFEVLFIFLIILTIINIIGLKRYRRV